MTRESAVRIKRVYDDPAPADGHRVLVDRVWPRGLGNSAAGDAEMIHGLAPATPRRRGVGHAPERFAEFAERYRAELEGSDALARLRTVLDEHRVVTLLYGARDTEHNQAVVLRDLLR